MNLHIKIQLLNTFKYYRRKVHDSCYFYLCGTLDGIFCWLGKLAQVVAKITHAVLENGKNSGNGGPRCDGNIFVACRNCCYLLTF